MIKTNHYINLKVYKYYGILDYEKCFRYQLEPIPEVKQSINANMFSKIYLNLYIGPLAHTNSSDQTWPSCNNNEELTPHHPRVPDV